MGISLCFLCGLDRNREIIRKTEPCQACLEHATGPQKSPVSRGGGWIATWSLGGMVEVAYGPGSIKEATEDEQK